MSQKEIEVKLVFKNKKEVIAKLKPKIRFQKKINIYDRYYSQKNLDMRNTHPLIRIRKIGKGESELTYKGATRDRHKIWHRLELTTKIASPEIMNKILISLGFKKISEYKSHKEYWKFNNLEIIFNKFIKPTSLEFMEIEGQSEKAIKNIIKKLGKSVQKVGEEIFEVFDKKRK